MSATLAPFGMRPIFHPSGLDRARAYIAGIATGYASAMYRGSPVKLTTSGTVNLAAASGADMIGAFDGCEYLDANGKPTYSTYWPASQAATNTVAYVWDDPNTVFEMQAEGALAQTAIGDQTNFSVAAGYGVGDGSTLTGLSTCAMTSTLAGAGSQGMLSVRGLSLYPDNAWGDAYTVAQVVMARHQYVAVKVAI